MEQKPADMDLKTLESVARDGDAYAQFHLAYRYYMGKMDFSKFKNTSYRWKECPEKDWSKACHWFIEAERNGLNIEEYKNKTKIFTSNTLSGVINRATNDDAQAQLNLYYYYIEGDLESDIEAAIRWLFKAANTGNSEAGRILGYHYYSGIGVVKDISAAEMWYKKVATHFNSEAMFSLWKIYSDEESPQYNRKAALEWLIKAFRCGHFEATTTLAGIYKVKLQNSITNIAITLMPMNKERYVAAIKGDLEFAIKYNKLKTVIKSISASGWIAIIIGLILMYILFT